MVEIIKKSSIWIILITLSVIIYFVPIKIPNNVSSVGRIYPTKRWVLYAGTNGQIMASLKDIKAGITNEFSAREFVRGDDVRFVINSELFEREFVNKYDTIGFINSLSTSSLLTSYKSQLDVYNALLKVKLSGNKKEDIEIAEKKLQLAILDSEVQKKRFDRQKKLYEEDVIPEQEFETQEKLANLKIIQAELNKAELESLTVGEKPEEINYIKAQIDQLKSDIRDLETKVNLQTLISPISGTFRNTYSRDTLIMIEDVSELIVKVPVVLSFRPYMYLGQKFNCTIEGQNSPIEAEIIHIGNSVKYMQAQQYLLVTCKIEKPEKDTYSGAIVVGKLKGDPITLKQYASRIVKTFSR
nr:hypothetical protein [Bacteroidota bacterium]